MSELIILNEKGDDRTIWTKNDAEAYRKAKEQFNNLKAKGWLGYRVAKYFGEIRKEEIKEFDPEAEFIKIANLHNKQNSNVVQEIEVIKCK